MAEFLPFIREFVTGLSEFELKERFLGNTFRTGWKGRLWVSWTPKLDLLCEEREKGVELLCIEVATRCDATRKQILVLVSELQFCLLNGPINFYLHEVKSCQVLDLGNF